MSQCCGITKNNIQCSRISKGKYCYQHQQHSGNPYHFENLQDLGLECLKIDNFTIQIDVIDGPKYMIFKIISEDAISIPNFEETDVIRADHLKIPEFYNITSLQDLSLKDSEIRYIPDLKNLTTLILKNSKLLQALPSLKSLINLDVSYSNLIELPLLENLINLEISGTKISKIMLYQNLQKLFANNCYELKSIESPGLTVLEIKDNQKLVNLSHLHKIIRLEAKRCKKLKYLPLSAMQDLDISGSRLILEIPKSCKFIRCIARGCLSLISCPNFEQYSAVTTINFSGCPFLVTPENIKSLPLGNLGKIIKIQRLFRRWRIRKLMNREGIMYADLVNMVSKYI